MAQLSRPLERWEFIESTPCIGREYPCLNLKDLLIAPDSDDLLRDLAKTVSERGVVFFRKQENLDIESQKELTDRLGRLSGRPKSSGLYIHPVSNSKRDFGESDDVVTVIDSAKTKKLYHAERKPCRNDWHSDITFEKVPSDYSVLCMTKLPKTGGDTLWASGYELYDRLSRPYQKFLETLTMTCSQPLLLDTAMKNGYDFHTGPRGSPENYGTEMTATHPVVRTNPVSGWKSVYAVGYHVEKIDGVTREESNSLLNWFLTSIAENHDLQVRYKWMNPYDVAIWDNRSVFHSATYDVPDQEHRSGRRVMSVGERPFLDPESRSRAESSVP